MKKDEIRHRGKVVEITPEVTRVEFIQESACAGCHAKGMCGAADMAEKEVEVPTDPYGFYEVGEEVDVVLQKSMGLKAVWICYGVPLIVLLVATLVLSAVGVKEVYMGLGAIAAVAIYYLVIYICRDKLSKDYVFTIRKH